MTRALVIIDGMADLPGHETDFRMESLHSMPVIEYISTETRRGIPPSSERAIMSILGYDIANLNISRSRLEALALGLNTDGQNVYRVNIVTPDGRPADISDSEARQIATHLGPQYHAMDRYRMLLTTEESNPQLPDSLVLIPGDQRLDPVTPLSTPTRIIAATHLMEGIARHVGAHFLRPAGATGHVDTDIRAKSRAAIESIFQATPLTVVHIEAPDEAAHLKDTKLKADLLAQIDLFLISELLKTGVELTVLGDHITDAVTGHHHAGLVAVRSNRR